jgi:hypothetical protein
MEKEKQAMFVMFVNLLVGLTLVSCFCTTTSTTTQNFDMKDDPSKSFEPLNSYRESTVLAKHTV